MKIYEFYYNDSPTDWVLARDKEDAMDFYIKTTECIELIGYTIKEVPRDEWDNMYIVDPYNCHTDRGYNGDGYSNGYKIIESFKEHVDGVYDCLFIATSDF